MYELDSDFKLQAYGFRTLEFPICGNFDPPVEGLTPRSEQSRALSGLVGAYICHGYFFLLYYNLNRFEIMFSLY